MLTGQRQQRILETLGHDGQIVASRLAAELAVSEDTVRRDLAELARQGLLLRVHGGALPAAPAAADLSVRRQVSIPEKAAIARAAAARIRPGQVVLLDGGTTAVALARALPHGLAATIVTHSPAVAVELEGHACEVILIGGRLFRHSMVAVGASALEAIGRIRADLYVMGVTGLESTVGLTTGDAEEAGVKRALMRAAAETLVLASPEKVGAASPHVIAPVTAAATVITTVGAPAEALARIAALGVEIVRI
ncbi:MAG TPA: DeoR/GlpR family DNA-binding transcription regulator [Phenylobacterium sp.]